jgi:hypothetical protein
MNFIDQIQDVRFESFSDEFIQQHSYRLLVESFLYWLQRENKTLHDAFVRGEVSYGHIKQYIKRWSETFSK